MQKIFCNSIQMILKAIETAGIMNINETPNMDNENNGIITSKDDMKTPRPSILKMNMMTYNQVKLKE